VSLLGSLLVLSLVLSLMVGSPPTPSIGQGMDLMDGLLLVLPLAVLWLEQFPRWLVPQLARSSELGEG
jgi:riboflavin transporter FmnP